MRMFPQKMKCPKPYKTYHFCNRSEYQYQYFHGYTREWCEITVYKNGEVYWQYACIKPFQNVILESGKGFDVQDNRLPFWMKRYMDSHIKEKRAN